MSLKSNFLQVCDKNQIRKEKKTEYILRERDILKHLTDNWNTNVPYFVRLHASFHVRIFNAMLIFSIWFVTYFIFISLHTMSLHQLEKRHPAYTNTNPIPPSCPLLGEYFLIL